MEKILRVFLRRTSYTPDDDLVAIGEPDLLNSKLAVDEVHISVVFSWDIPRARWLARSWERFYPVVKLGGPAFGLDEDEFVAGKYVKQGVTFTTRGCNNNCPWCLVLKMEGKFRELNPIAHGHIIQDNNILMASIEHFRKVCSMLKANNQVASFKGGFDARLLTKQHTDILQYIKIKDIFLAFDSDSQATFVKRAVDLLKSIGLRRDQLRCYCLIGFKNETIEDAEKRLRLAWDIGTLPFAQVYQPPQAKKRNVPKEWRALARMWSRPAATKKINRDRKS